MSTFVIIVIVLVVLWAIGSLFEWVSEHKKAVLSFLGVIVAIFFAIFLLPKIWPFISSGLQLAIQNWPFLLILLACYGVYRYSQRKKTQEFVMWIDRMGIAKKSEASVKQSILDLAEKDGSITILIPGMIFLKSFITKLPIG